MSLDDRIRRREVLRGITGVLGLAGLSALVRVRVQADSDFKETISSIIRACGYEGREDFEAKDLEHSPYKYVTYTDDRGIKHHELFSYNAPIVVSLGPKRIQQREENNLRFFLLRILHEAGYEDEPTNNLMRAIAEVNNLQLIKEELIPGTEYWAHLMVPGNYLLAPYKITKLNDYRCGTLNSS